MPWRARFREVGERLNPSGLLYSTYEQRLFAELDRDRLPRHVAVLADGNRRWARLNAPIARWWRATVQVPTSSASS